MNRGTLEIRDKVLLTRRVIKQGFALGLSAFSLSAGATAAQAQPATSSISPGSVWDIQAPEATGLKREGLAAVEQRLYALPTTALMVVTANEVAYRYGDTVIPQGRTHHRCGTQEMSPRDQDN